jgi:hypothetical protein
VELAAAALVEDPPQSTALLEHQTRAAVVVAVGQIIQPLAAMVVSAEAASSASATSARPLAQSLAQVTLHQNRVATPSIPSLNPATW